MNLRFVPIAGLLAMSLSACGQVAMNAGEFRTGYVAVAEPESFVVSRPFDQVAGTVEQRAGRCLDVTVTTTSWVGNQRMQSTFDYNPTVLVHSGSAELHLQQNIVGAVTPLTPPNGGYYIFVADFVPVTAGSTRVDLYAPAMGYEVLSDAVRGWAEGTTSGCPDLTKA